MSSSGDEFDVQDLSDQLIEEIRKCKKDTQKKIEGLEEKYIAKANAFIGSKLKDLENMGKEGKMEMEGLQSKRRDLIEQLHQLRKDLSLSDENCVQVLPTLKERLSGVKEDMDILLQGLQTVIKSK